LISEKVSTSETVIAVLRRADGQKTVIKEEGLEEKIERLKQCVKQLKSNLERKS